MICKQLLGISVTDCQAFVWLTNVMGTLWPSKLTSALLTTIAKQSMSIAKEYQAMTRVLDDVPSLSELTCTQARSDLLKLS